MPSATLPSSPLLSPSLPFPSHRGSSSQSSLLALNSPPPDMTSFGSFLCKKTSLAHVRAVCVRAETCQLGTDNQSDTQSQQGPEALRLQPRLGQTMPFPGPGQSAASAHASPSSASAPKRVTSRVRKRKQTAPSTAPAAASRRGERTPAQRAAPDFSSEASLRAAGACRVDRAQGSHQSRRSDMGGGF